MSNFRDISWHDVAGAYDRGRLDACEALAETFDTLAGETVRGPVERHYLREAAQTCRLATVTVKANPTSEAIATRIAEAGEG